MPGRELGVDTTLGNADAYPAMPRTRLTADSHVDEGPFVRRRRGGALRTGGGGGGEIVEDRGGRGVDAPVHAGLAEMALEGA